MRAKEVGAAAPSTRWSRCAGYLAGNGLVREAPLRAGGADEWHAQAMGLHITQPPAKGMTCPTKSASSEAR